MEAKDLLKKVRKIEIKTRGLSRQIFAGEYHSAFKGRGMTFSEVREYQYGDDIRSIDWNVTARFNHPYVKVFEEERELTVMLLIDVSGSGDFGTREQLKRGLITEIAAVLSFSAIENNDKIGVILFSDRVEKFIPPQKGRKHILRIIRELLDFKARSHGVLLSSYPISGIRGMPVPCRLQTISMMWLLSIFTTGVKLLFRLLVCLESWMLKRVWSGGSIPPAASLGKITP